MWKSKAEVNYVLFDLQISLRFLLLLLASQNWLCTVLWVDKDLDHSTVGSQVANIVTSSQLLQTTCDSRVELGPVQGSFQNHHFPPFILSRSKTLGLHSICCCIYLYFYLLYVLPQRVGDVASSSSLLRIPPQAVFSENCLSPSCPALSSPLLVHWEPPWVVLNNGFRIYS